MTKRELIDYALRKPIAFDMEGKFSELIKDYLQLDFSDLREMVRRIYNMTEKSLRSQSDASTGSLGKLNKKSTANRTKRFYKKIDNNFRDLAKPGNKVILAEGDSWFQFPVCVKDIIDWLMENDAYAVYSIAYGGDWIANIVHEEKYIEELTTFAPDVFLRDVALY